MNKTFYIPDFAFEVLVRSQCDAPIYLPGEQQIENSSDNDIIYSIHSMVESGALVVDEKETGFNINPEFEVIVKSIVNAKAILRTMRVDNEYPVYYYISDTSVAFIETVANRSNTYRIGSVLNGELPQLICENMNLSDDDSENPDKIESFQDLVFANGYDDSIESEILGTDLKKSIDKVLETEDVLCAIDVIKAKSGRIKSRWVVYHAAVLEKMAVINSKNVTESSIYSYDMFSEKVNSILEEIK